MANALYDAGRAAFANKEIDWDADDIRCIPLDNSDAVNLTTDDFLDDVAAGARIATAVALTGKTNSAGILDCNDITFPAGTITASKTIIGFLFYLHTGTESTSRLIYFCDTAQSGAISIPTGTTPVDINFRPDNGTNKLFKL